MTECREAPGTAGEPVWTRIGQAVMLHRAGDREEARNRLTELWRTAQTGTGPVQRCTIAHYLAAAQDDPQAALGWDLRALAEAEKAAAPPYGPAEQRAARALRPALYLRLALDHAGLGHRTAARHELHRASRAALRLADDDYGSALRAAIGRLADQLEAAPGFPPGGLGR